MSFEDNILLKLRRQFSGQEKYRLFLQQLDRLEIELKRERELNTELMKKIATVEDLQAEVDEYTGKGIGKTCVKMKTHNKAINEKKKWEALYIETYHKLQELQKQQQDGNSTTSIVNNQGRSGTDYPASL
jgi:hypothetical protein